MTKPEPAPCPTCETVTEPWSWCDTVQRYECEVCDRVFIVRCVVGQRDSGGQNAPQGGSDVYTFVITESTPGLAASTADESQGSDHNSTPDETRRNRG